MRRIGGGQGTEKGHVRRNTGTAGRSAKSDERLTGELENKTIKWLSTWDINSDATGKTTPVELAIFQERYGGKIEGH